MKPRVAGRDEPWRVLRIGSWVALAAAIVLSLAVRAQLLDIPFERDEGTYAYFGVMVLDGAVPYRSFYEVKPPGLFYAYALMVLIFGEGVRGLHVGFAILSLATALAVYATGRRLYDAPTGALAAASFVLLAVSPGASGFAVQSEHLVALFASLALLSFVVYSQGGSRAQLWASGMFSAAALLIKQTGGFVILALCLAISHRMLRSGTGGLGRGLSELRGYLASVLGVVGIAGIVMAWLGVLGELWFWLVELPSSYAGSVSLEIGVWRFEKLLGVVSDGYEGFWLLGAVGLAVTAVGAIREKLVAAEVEPDAAGQQDRPGAGASWGSAQGGRCPSTLLLWFSLCSALAIIPGLRFYGHYWLQLMPALALLIGAATHRLRDVRIPGPGRHMSACLGLALFILAAAHTVQAQRSYFFAPDLNEVMRAIYYDNPFAEAKFLGDFVRKNARPDDRLVVIGSEPEVYLYSGLTPGTRHVYFGWTLISTDGPRSLQAELRSDLEADAPEILVFFDHPRSFAGMTDLAVRDDFYAWFADFRHRHDYIPIAVADIGPGVTKYVLGGGARRYQPQSSRVVWVLRRRNVTSQVSE